MEIMNSTHDDPDALINKPIQTLFLDGFVYEFNHACKMAMAGKGPQFFTCLVNFNGQLEVRQCRVLKKEKGLLVVNHKLIYLS